MIRGERIFITGGAGFIGTKLVEQLVEQNEIVVFDNLRRCSIDTSPMRHHPNLKLIQGNVCDYDFFRESARDTTLFFHLAAIAGVDNVVKHPIDTMEVNLKGTINACQVAENLPSLKRFIFFSTSEVLGSFTYFAQEDNPAVVGPVKKGRWIYAASKLAAEHLVFSHFSENHLPTVIVRPFNVYGPGQVGEGAIHDFVIRALKNEPLSIHGEGNQIRAWCYIDDMVRGTLLAAENPAGTGEIFNIGNPRSTLTILYLAKMIVQLAESSSALEFMEMKFSDVELRVPNIEKAKQILGYAPLIDLEEGLLKTIEWYRSI